MIQQPKRLLFLSTRAKLGLSSIVKGLLVSLKEAGISVRVDMLGDSLLEATHIRRTTGRICQCLAPNLLTKEQILYGYGLSLSSCEVHILVCNDVDYIKQNKDLIEQIDPVVVVIFDAEKDREDDFDTLIKFASEFNRYEKVGLIGNLALDTNIASYQKLIDSENIRLLGLIPKFDEGKFAGDSSLSVNRNPSLLTRNQILRLKNLVENHVRFNDFREHYKQSRDVSFAKIKTQFEPRCRIAVADDSAFHLSFQDNLNLLREYGAELKLFSPLAEHALPDGIDAIYFPNSYLNLYAEEIEHNKKLLTQIRESIYSGVLAYFEGDSFAYATSKVFFDNGNSSQMLGVLNAEVSYFYPEVEKHPVGKFTAINESIITKGKEVCKGLLNDKLRLTGESQFSNVFTIADQKNLNATSAAIIGLSNVICTSSIIHWGSNPALAENFVLNSIKVGKSGLSR
jgi:cobyrinic acid a,c-diamide synthase